MCSLLLKVIKMNKIVILLSTLTIMSCAPEFYSPNRINIPELKHKKDLRITAAKGYLGFEAQMAYAITNKIGLITNYANYVDGEDSEGFDGGNGSGLEFGTGYFTSKENFIFENYASIGFGSFYNRAKFISPIDKDDDGKIDSDFTKISIQSSLTYQSKYFSISSAVRYTNLTYNNIEGNYTYLSYNLGNHLRGNPVHNFIEPALQLGCGYKNIRLNLQYQRSFHLGADNYYFYNNYNYSAGIQLSFPSIKTKRKDEVKAF